MSTSGVHATEDRTASEEADAFVVQFARFSAEQKRVALYWLLRDQLGDRPDQESDVCDPEGFLYVHLVPPGLRERLRLLEHPELEEQLKASAAEPTFSLQQIREEMGASE